MLEGNGLVKLMEECGELIQIAAKKMAMMDSDEHWDKKGSMKARMEEEIADVVAICGIVVENFKLDRGVIYARVEEKMNKFRYWMKHE